MTGLKQYSDLAFSPYILTVALVELFLGSGLHIGTTNSFNLESIYQSYDAAVQYFNELRQGSHKGKIEPLTKDGLMYYLKKPAFEEFSKCLFEKVFVFSHNHILASQMLREGQLLIQSLNTYLPTPIIDVIAHNGCYKVVDGELHSEYKGARTAKKDSVNEDGYIEKVKNAQLGIQTSLSIVNNCPTKIGISSGVASEREYVQAQKSTLNTCDAGYYSVGLIDDFDSFNAYIVVREKE